MTTTTAAITKPEEKILRHGLALYGAVAAADADLQAAELSLRAEEPRLIKTVANLGGSITLDGHLLEISLHDRSPVYPADVQALQDRFDALLKKLSAAKEEALRDGRVVFDRLPSELIITPVSQLIPTR